MTHWFHRNPLKATSVQRYDVRKVAMKSDFSKIMSDLRLARSTLLESFTDPSATPETMSKFAENYFSLLGGLINAPAAETKSSSQEKTTETEGVENLQIKDDEAGATSQDTNTELKSFFRFKWTQSLWVSKPPVAVNDAEFEQVNMALNVAIWYTKFASKTADKNEISMEDAKVIHKTLKEAAGIFKEIKDNHAGRLLSGNEKSSDMDARVLDCYIACCQAEAQEVTLARAVELKHSSNLIASLADDTSSFFQRADSHLKTLDQNVVMKWRKYIQLKQAFYKAYAYCYHGETLLNDEKCGDAIKCLTESDLLCKKSSQLSKEYMSTKGAGSTVRPHEHNFFKRLLKQVHFTLEKLKRENGFIFHQKVPEVLPEMNLKATYGLVQPESYTMPAMSPLWTKTIYAGFSVSKNVKKDKNIKSEKEGDVVPVKEPDIKVTKDNGCVIA